MSTLTKVFTVVLSVFSIAFATMVVSAVAQQTNWRDLALKYEQQAKVADTNLRSMIAASSADLAAKEDAVRAQMQRVGEISTQLAAKTNELNQVRAEAAKTQIENSNAQAMNRGLLNQLQVAEDARAEYRKQRDELEKRGIDLERRNVDLNDRVNELTANMAVVLEEKRQLEQQINVLKGEPERFGRSSGRGAGGSLSFESASGAALPGVTAATNVARAVIRGQVAEVDGDLVTISVGGADGVKKGMIFDISRGSNYIGSLLVLAVEPNSAAGRLIRSTQGPLSGDLVRDAPSVDSTP